MHLKFSPWKCTCTKAVTENVLPKQLKQYLGHKKADLKREKKGVLKESRRKNFVQYCLETLTNF